MPSSAIRSSPSLVDIRWNDKDGVAYGGIQMLSYKSCNNQFSASLEPDRYESSGILNPTDHPPHCEQKF